MITSVIRLRNKQCSVNHEIEFRYCSAMTELTIQKRKQKANSKLKSESVSLNKRTNSKEYLNSKVRSVQIYHLPSDKLLLLYVHKT